MLRFLPGELLVNGKGVYRADDMTLEYEASGSLPREHLQSLAGVVDEQFGLHVQEELLLIADTLTLTFSGVDHHLRGLDAYTNKQLWDVSSLKAVPKIDGQGALLAETAFFDPDRRSLDLIPKYEVAPDQRWVRVVLREGTSIHHYEVASNLVVGLRDGVLEDIYLLDVAYL